MKLLILLLMVTFVISDDVVPARVNPYRNYQDPYNQNYNYNTYGGYRRNYNTAESTAPILRQTNEHNFDGSYKFDFETGNGISQQEQGRLKDPDTSEVTGTYRYQSPEGKIIQVDYIADENGFRTSGDHRGLGYNSRYSGYKGYSGFPGNYGGYDRFDGYTGYSGYNRNRY